MITVNDPNPVRPSLLVPLVDELAHFASAHDPGFPIEVRVVSRTAENSLCLQDEPLWPVWVPIHEV